MNLVEMIKSQLLSSDLIARIASMLGLSSDNTRGAIGAALPALLAGLSKVASTPDGARRLASAVDSADESILRDGADALAGGGKSVIESGTNMLSSVLGGNTLSGMGSALSRFSGLGSGAIMSLLGMLAPMIFGFFKSKKREMGLDASGLASMLTGQQKNIMGAMPAGLSNMLSSVPGLGGVAEAAREGGDWAREKASAAYASGRDVTRDAGYAARTATAGASSALRWALPLLVLLALGALIWWAATRTPEATREAAAPQPRPDLSDARSVTPTTGPGALSPSDSARLAAANVPGADQLATVREEVTGFFRNATETFRGITDPASAEAALPKLRDYNTRLDSLRGVVNTLPAESRTQVNSLMSSSFDTFKPLVDRAMSIPGVSEKIRPVVDEMQKKLTELMGG